MTICPVLARRLLSLLALLSLFGGLPQALRAEAVARVYIGVGFGLLYGSLLLTAVLILTARTAVAQARLDVAVLLAGIVRLVLFLASGVGPGASAYHADEGALVTMAARSLAAGGHVYGVHFASTGHLFHVPMTGLMSGTTTDVYGYPPLSAVLTALGVGWLPAWVPVAGLWSVAALATTAVVLFQLLPVALRPAAVLLVFGMPWMYVYAREGYPAYLTLPFLVVVVGGWSRIGEDGRLGRQGAASAACLGLADSAHQLAWFLTPFVLLAVLLLRRGSETSHHRPWRWALALTARYAALAAMVFALVDGPVLIRDGRASLTGVMTVLTQHAEPQGVGPVDISFYLTRGSGSLGLFTAAAAALYFATLAVYLFFPRRMAPALAVLPWPAFFLSTRSTETYFVLLAPLWAAALAGNSAMLTERSWQWRPASAEAARGMRFLPALLAAPACALLAAALTTPPPVRATVQIQKAAGGGIRRISVTVLNTGDWPLTPAFGTSDNASIDLDWKVTGGPRILAAHNAGHYILIRTGPPFLLNPAGATYLRILTDQPATMTNERLG